MAKKRKKQNKKWLWWGLAIVLVIVAVIVGVVIWQNNSGEDRYNEEQGAETSDREEIMEGEIEATTEEAELKSEGVEKKKVVQYEGEDPNTAEELSGSISYAGVVDQKLMIRVNIDQYLGSGRCELSLIRDGATIYTETANVDSGASTSTCQGFDVPVAGLGGGNIQINIKVSADGREGTIRGEANI